MGSKLLRLFLVALALSSCVLRGAAQEQQFRWIDFHSEKDQSYVTWVTRSMDAQKWTAIREIGVLYDAALVVTTERANLDASPGTDIFQIWSVSLTTHRATPLLKGVNLRWLDWMNISDVGGRELGAFYDDCRDCAATTYFTTFHFDTSQHLFLPRWVRGAGQAAPVWTGAVPPGVEQTQVYALLTEPSGSQAMETWTHFDYGKQKPPDDYLYRYDLEPFTRVERTELVVNKQAEILKQRLCSVQGLPPQLARGQDSALCQQTVHPKAERRVVTTPPANNQGRSAPPGVRR